MNGCASGGALPAQLHHEAPHARVARRRSRGRRRGPARSPSRCGPCAGLLDEVAVRLAGAGLRTARRRRAAGESVDASMAGFDGRPRSADRRRGRRARGVGGHLVWPVLPGGWPASPADGLAMPAAFRYSDAVSRRTPVALSMRRSGQPSRPSATTCCSFRIAQDVAHAARGASAARRVNVSAQLLWPVLRCPPMAGFGCPPRIAA